MSLYLLLIVLSDSPQPIYVAKFYAHRADCLIAIRDFRKGVIPEKTEIACYRMERSGAYLRGDR